MSEAKFTPGPWGYKLSSPRSCPFYEIAPYGDDGELDWDREIATTFDDNEQHARLIAALPRMHDALYRVLCLLNGSHDGYIGMTQDGHIAFDRKAIDRAELVLKEALAAVSGEE